MMWTQPGVTVGSSGTPDQAVEALPAVGDITILECGWVASLQTAAQQVINPNALLAASNLCNSINVLGLNNAVLLFQCNQCQLYCMSWSAHHMRHCITPVGLCYFTRSLQMPTLVCGWGRLVRVELRTYSLTRLLPSRKGSLQKVRRWHCHGCCVEKYAKNVNSHAVV